MKRLLLGMTLSFCVLTACAPSPDKQLETAKAAATAGDYRQALSIVDGLPSDSAAYAEAQVLAPDWRHRLETPVRPSDVGATPVPSSPVVAPTPISAVPTDPAKVAKVVENAREVQAMLESYGLDFNGKYPTNFAGLAVEAKKNKYWKELKNPLNPTLPAITDHRHPLPGAVAYEFLGADKAKYHIHSWDGQSKPVLGKDGKVFLVDGIY
ncbi:MAG: hypothetical protein H7338_18030 [Candidatus Sericytochromatia bacterium]|nr:hypothetical protein [Candidatus Sericytochromatia bacterium]